MPYPVDYSVLFDLRCPGARIITVTQAFLASAQAEEITTKYVAVLSNVGSFTILTLVAHKGVVRGRNGRGLATWRWT